MKAKSSIYILFIILSLSSCASSKKVAYLNVKERADIVKYTQLHEVRIMPKDILAITIQAEDRELVKPYLSTVPTISTIRTIISDEHGRSEATPYPYLVDNQGNINMPILGTLHLQGLTVNEAETVIEKQLSKDIKNPMVVVKLSNYKISILGEVNKPGIVTGNDNKLSIFDALAAAGDMTIHGKRDNIKIIRELATGAKEIGTINLLDEQCIESPYFYLQQNDIVYVEPNKVRSNDSSLGKNKNVILAVTGTMISLAYLLITILR